MFSPNEVHMVELFDVLGIDNILKVGTKVQVHVDNVSKPVL